MRTTLDIDDEVLAATKELARQEGRTAGAVLSDLARKGLSAGRAGTKRQTSKNRNGVPVLPRRKEVITVEKIRRLMDEEGV